MKRNILIVVQVVLFAIIQFSVGPVFGDDQSPIKLPEPRTEGGKPLMTALKERKSTRAFSDKSISQQMMSNLLWAAWGINRPDSGGRTAPSAHDRQEIDIYLADVTGAFRYDAQSHSLVPILSQDIRALTGNQQFVKTAPVNLIYVADFSKMSNNTSVEKTFYAATDTGFISQNVYLFCASEGLATVVRAWVDKEKLAKAIKLKPNQKIVLVQTIGYPEPR